MQLEDILILSAFLFCMGLYGLITSKNVVRALMCLELLLNSVNLNFIGFSAFMDPLEIKGQVLVVFVMTIAAAEAAIGLALVLAIYRNRDSVNLEQFNLLKW
uniref:subunit 4L of NADH-plastoquinone oxidoreductase n=1 Tax=Streptofilum capillatum TaxID=2058781 RepID=UPI00286D2211|nr:subunit 4L of NADH-plastoquinone oxidoreductase [Streptofilum capillatum]YP_010933353.1 subunit 4L of NADH-plastoquinone oxidoreductase [Streptofilum capillatum]WKT08668.1 subunit 4L of NADH-plastoquinone oxidoreductase [Streptofilum sp. BC4-VF8pt]WKT08767.1 subunit 4L of NADH-plastoquinone oxidoreductase [Streptofilum sp. ZNP2-VF4pt]WKT08569.1 subunit 4L of NADH-plastoquinone oxidoreductase [Streptofilum capillatum]WKT08570.1 subunit 4L of NADH-plastoquinone oxidoreductase [Streptofilum ca